MTNADLLSQPIASLLKRLAIPSSLGLLFITPLKNKLKNQLAYRTFGCLKKLATF
jgi:hypothetical protein